jgi:serine protease Do
MTVRSSTLVPVASSPRCGIWGPWSVGKTSAPLALSIAALSLSGLTAAWMVADHWALSSALPWVSEPSSNVQQAFNATKGLNHPLLNEDSSLIADVAEAIAPSVVNIDVQKGGGTAYQQGDVPGMPFDDDLLNRFFGFGGGDGGNGSPFFRFQIPGRGGLGAPTVTGNGSGVVIDNQGHILTNNHVVSGAKTITVTLKDGRKVEAKIVGRDRYSDLAVLKIDAPGLVPAKLGASDKLRPGEWVLAIGSPLGFDHSVTLGIISAISRRVPDLNANVDFIQTDAAINPGNSGGPLVNLRGEVVGINTAISGRGQNIGFAIPVNTVKQVSDSLIAHGQITRPWIGISMTEMTPELSKSLGLPESTKGIIVAQVVPNSPADKGGFQQGDIIQRIDGKVVTDAKQIQELSAG